MPPTTTTTSTQLEIKEEETPSLEILPFALRLPPSFCHPSPGSGDDAAAPQIMTDVFLPDSTGIVGTITILRKAVMIWFGWGNLELGGVGGGATESSSQPTSGEAGNKNWSRSKPPPMGPLMVAMPRIAYQGAFSSDGSATTKLVGSDDEDEELTCRQMASRLTAKLGVSVFCSCSLTTGAAMPTGMDPTTASWMPQRAAALAEKHVYQMLKDRQDFL
eukprot:scaffold5787_cov157-Amphora_coffeaeformis.AAC.10